MKQNKSRRGFASIRARNSSTVVAHPSTDRVLTAVKFLCCSTDGGGRSRVPIMKLLNHQVRERDDCESRSHSRLEGMNNKVQYSSVLSLLFSATVAATVEHF